MERKTKIEPGCRVILIGSKHSDCPNIWKMGIAEYQIGPDQTSPNGMPYHRQAIGTWFVSGEGLCTRLSSRDINTDIVLDATWVEAGYMIAFEHNLMRIDDEDPDQVKVKDRELENA